MSVLLLAFAGGVGAWLRAEVAWAAARRAAPRWGTHVVNLLGAAALGALTGTGAALDADLRRVLGVGLLGGFTTFSTWMVQAEGDGPVTGAARTLPVLVVGVALGALGRALVTR